jgi:hypothetical protein
MKNAALEKFVAPLPCRADLRDEYRDGSHDHPQGGVASQTATMDTSAKTAQRHADP